MPCSALLYQMESITGASDENVSLTRMRSEVRAAIEKING
jgi:hypothetical protein